MTKYRCRDAFMESYQAVTSSFLGVILLLGSIKVVIGNTANEAHLIRDLFKDYDPDARPVKNATDAVTVTFDMAYVILQDLDEPTQAANSLVWITLRWNDAFLRWNSSNYGGQSLLYLKSSRMWTPDIVLYNSVADESAHITSEQRRIIVNSDGNVTWLLTNIIYSACPIDVSRFPFDTQKCVLKFSSWVYDGLALDLQLYQTNGIELQYLKENAEWKLQSITSQRNKKKYKCCLAPYYDIEYTLEFRRKPLYYVMTIIFPSMLLSLLSFISFLFPADSGERVSLVISVLLGLVVFMLIVNERTPVTSESVPMITEFFNFISACTVLALIATAFILRLNHASSGKPVPNYLANIRNCIAVALCMKKPPPAKRVEINFDDILLTESSAQWLNVPDLASKLPPRKPFTEEIILKELLKFSRHLEEETVASKIKEDWRFTMRVFDRFFLIIFVLIFSLFAGYVFSYF